MDEKFAQKIDNTTSMTNDPNLAKKAAFYDVDQIKIRARMRELKDLTQLKESIKKSGLLQPIVVTKDNFLIAGYHRLQAFKELGISKIPVIIKDVDQMTAELMEIDENLIRHELTELEKSEQLQKRKEIYEILHPNSTHDAIVQNNFSKRNNFAPKENTISSEKSFTQDVAEKTGQSQRTIQQSLQIANNLTDEAVDRIKGTKLENNKTALLEIARIAPEEQVAKAEELLHKDVASKKIARPLNIAYKMDFVRKKVVIDGKWESVPADCDMENASYTQIVNMMCNK